LFWETTIKCNLACAHCRRLESDEAAVRDLTSSQARDIIEQLTALGKSQSFMPILVFSGGEPLCRTDIFELAQYANNLGITTALATNGTLIDADIAEQIYTNGIRKVSVSLDGATAEVHNRQRRSQNAFESALEGIRHLREKNISFQINVTLTKSNAAQTEALYELARSLGADALHFFMLVPVGCGQILAETDMLSPQQYEDKLVEINRLENKSKLQIKVTCGPHYQRVIRQQQTQHSKLITQHSRRGCLAGLGVLFVGHQGDIFPCGYLPVNCGNILDKPLSEIWRNNLDLLKMCNSNNLGGKCGNCDYRQVCGGCRARAYAATGDYMSEEPFCIYIPE
jgi:AdoMet-dependent heme synthase